MECFNYKDLGKTNKELLAGFFSYKSLGKLTTVCSRRSFRSQRKLGTQAKKVRKNIPLFF